MRERDRQLRTIGELQRHFLPRALPSPAGWRLAAHYALGPWPGGDYYDFLSFPDGRVLIAVADASDQGGPAAALVAMVRVLLHSCPQSSGVDRLPFCPLAGPALQPPHVLLSHLNRVLVENSLEEQFLTAFCGVLQPGDGKFHYANAGHPAPRWWHAASRTVEPLRDAVGLPLGLDSKAVYHHKRIEIEPGDLLVLYSDGLTATSNRHTQMFGCQRLDEALRDAAPRGASAVKAAILERFEDFLVGGEPQDDVTLIVIERLDG
jgi:phosphoserine phosphatase RsbU/P